MKKTTLILGVFFLFWTGATAALDVSLARNLIHQSRTDAYASTPGLILHSEIQASSDDDGTSYTPRIVYSYRVGGRSYEATRIRFSLFTFGREGAAALIREHPPGSKPTVYFDPASPDRAVLQRGIEGTDLLPLVFSLPFNAIVGLGLLMILDKPLARRRTGSMIGGVRVWEEGGVIRARVRSESAPWAAGVGFAGAIGFVEIFLLALTPMRHFSAIVLGAWLLAIFAGAWVAIRMRSRIVAGDWDIIVDAVGRRVRSPLARGGRDLAFASVSRVVVRPGPSGEDGPSRWYVDLVHREGAEQLVAGSQADARSFAAWLEAQTGGLRGAARAA